jgi:hypothetical protein
MKKALHILPAIVFGLLLSEIICFGLVKLLFRNENYEDRYKLDFKKNDLVAAYLKDADYDGQIIANPLYGFQANPKEAPNNYGFLDSRDFPYQKKQNEFVIGLFGGSTALRLWIYLKKHPEALSPFEKDPFFKGKKLVILNFSLISMKQPQQYIISTRFGDTLDAAINIDGHNEILHPLHEDLPVVYPTYTNDLYFTAPQKRLLQSKFKNYIRLYGRLLWLPLHFKPLAHSSIYYFFWRLIGPTLYQKFDIFQDEILFHAETGLPVHFKTDAPSRLKARFEIWDKFTKLQAKILWQMHTPSFFFLLPNLNVSGSKSPTLFEKKLLQEFGEKNHRYFADTYSKMSREVLDLRKKGIAAYDLGEIFKNVSDTTYNDAWCHVNDLGNSIVAEKILRIVTNDIKNYKGPKLTQ